MIGYPFYPTGFCAGIFFVWPFSSGVFSSLESAWMTKGFRALVCMISFLDELSDWVENPGG